MVGLTDWEWYEQHTTTHSRSLSELGWWMHGRGVGQTAGRAVRPSSTCLEAARAKQHARHITATSSSHMVSRSLRKSLPTFAHTTATLPPKAVTKWFVKITSWSLLREFPLFVFKYYFHQNCIHCCNWFCWYKLGVLFKVRHVEKKEVRANFCS